MNIKAIMVICFWTAYLVGCIIAYIRHRKAKKEQDDFVCKTLGRYTYQINNEQIIKKIEL